MPAPAISVQRLAKRYHIGARAKSTTFREAVVGLACEPFRRIRGFGRSSHREEDSIWALKDVSFQVQPGEAVGVIGSNGAGKTTLLKVLSRITDPTEGSATINGRVASLLEVGTGFHGELTGRENIYLSGAILGMGRKETTGKFDGIVDFSGVENFIDTPVKRYSSGMRVRLGFAVAAYLEPEILLIDEVLAVGDAQFQRKCLGKMDEVAKGGRTVLFVSHNMRGIRRLCSRALWIDRGHVAACGPAGATVQRYLGAQASSQSAWHGRGPARSGDPVAFTTVQVRDPGGSSRTSFAGSEPVTIWIAYAIRRPLNNCQITAWVGNLDGDVLFYTGDTDSRNIPAVPRTPGRYVAVFDIPGKFLSPGRYVVSVAAHDPTVLEYTRIEHAVGFEVVPTGSVEALDFRKGLVAPLIEWETASLSEEAQ